jgi:hypothetical protein
VEPPSFRFDANGEPFSKAYRAQQYIAANSLTKAQRMADAILRINPDQDVAHLQANLGNDAAWQALATATKETLPSIETRTRVIDAINQRRAPAVPLNGTDSTAPPKPL